MAWPGRSPTTPMARIRRASTEIWIIRPRIPAMVGLIVQSDHASCGIKSMSSSVATSDLLHRTELAHPTDEDLAVRFQTTGCADSISELVRRHVRSVRAIIFPMVLDHATADDLTQETLVRAWRGLSGFRAEAKFSTWLTRIAWNVVQDE